MKINIQNKIRAAVIVALNIIVIFFVIFFINSEVSKERYERDKSSYSTTKNIQESIDSVIGMNMRFTNIIALSDEAKTYTSDETINYYHTSKLAQLIGNYNLFFGSKIYAFQPGKDIYISGGTTYHDADLIKECGTVPYDIKSLENLAGGCYSSYSMVEGIKEKNIVLVNKGVTVNGNDICFIITLSQESLNRFFVESDGEICLVENEKMIFGNGNLSAAEALKRSSIKINSNIIPDWSYLYISHGIISLWVYLKWILIILCLTAAATLAGWKLSDRIYRPVKSIVDRISGDDVVTNELEYVDRKITEIQERHIQLQNEMNEYFNRFEQQFFKNLIYGISTPDEIDEYEKRMGKNSVVEYTIVVLECQDDDEKYSLTFYEVYEYINKLQMGKIIGIGNKRVAIIVYRNNEDIIKKFTMILIGIEQKFEVHYIGATAGKYIDSLDKITNLFSVADRTLKNKALFGNNIMLSAQEFENDDFYYTVDMEKIIIDFVKNRNFNDALSAIDSVLKKNLVECELTHDALTDFKLAMVSTVKRTLKMLGKNETELFGSDFIMYIELGAAHTSEGMRQKVNSIFKTIFDSANDRNEVGSNFLVESILEYIHEYYNDSDKVCLAGMAEHFNVSTSYVSRIFKKYVNINYKEYVTSYRIEQAKKLLSEKAHLKVKDVAERVGYSNVNSFIRAFEKLESVTPDIYRKNIKNPD